MALKMLAAGACALGVTVGACGGDRLVVLARRGVAVSMEDQPQLRLLGVRSISAAMPFEPADPALASSVGLDRYYILDLAEGIDAAAAEGAVDRMVDAFERVEREQTGGVADSPPNDAFFAMQWGLRNTGQPIDCTFPKVPSATESGPYHIWACSGWEVATRAAAVRIAVLDSGVTQHPDLEPLLPGWSFDGQSTTDQCNHGTHVAGIIGARGNNQIGIAGVVWGAQIIPVRVLSGCTGSDTAFAQGLIWAADHAEIANSSLQYYNVGSMVQAAVQYAHGRGLIMVAASGNWSQVVAFPAIFPEVIAVGATGRHDERSAYSNRGPALDFAAPGDQIFSLDAYSGPPGYMCSSGTSMASPHIAGAAALVLAVRPGATAADVGRILAAGADDLGAPGHDLEFGWGRLNLGRSLRTARCQADADGSGQVSIQDLNLFTQRLQARHLYADLNGDGAWNHADQALYMGLYSQACAAHRR